MTNTNLLNKYHSDVTHYRSIISHTSHHKVDHDKA